MSRNNEFHNPETLLNPETLFVLFKSEPMQNLQKKGCSGTILIATGKPALEKIPIPLIDVDIQEVIQVKISESTTKRLESEQLLDFTKTAVEKAIKENEEKATKYINEKLVEFKIKIDHE